MIKKINKPIIFFILCFLVVIFYNGCINHCRVSFSTSNDFNNRILQSEIIDSVITVCCRNDYKSDSTIVVSFYFHTIDNYNIDSLKIQIMDDRNIPLRFQTVGFNVSDTMKLSITNEGTKFFTIGANHYYNYRNTVIDSSLIIDKKNINLYAITAKYNLQTKKFKKNCDNDIFFQFKSNNQIMTKFITLKFSFCLKNLNNSIFYNKLYKFISSTQCFWD